MSGSYMNSAELGALQQRPRRPQNQQNQPAQPVRHRQHQTKHRPRSVVSQRFSQVYDMAVESRPACLHKGAVTPMLWLVCQTMLVFLFAVCCVFLAQNSNSSGSSTPKNRWVGLRLELAIQNVNKTALYNSKGNYRLEYAGPEHTRYLKLKDIDGKHSEIEVTHAAVYNINAAVTFRCESSGFKVDASLNVDGKLWMSCMEDAPGAFSYTQCRLFGTRYLLRGSKLSFASSTQTCTEIVRLSHLTYFEIEMHQ